MHLTLIFVTVTLFWTSLEAIQCYRCAQELSKGDTIDPQSCVGGQFDKDDSALLKKHQVTKEECKSCAKYFYVLNGKTDLSRTCAPPELDNEDNCGDLKIGGLHQGVCICTEDYCNGAVHLNAHQVIIGLVTSVILTVVLTQY